MAEAWTGGILDQILTNLKAQDTNSLIATALTFASLLAALYFAYSPSPKSKYALNPQLWILFKLTKLEVISHNTRRYRFALQTPETVLGLPIGQHVYIQGVDADGAEFQRPYTPVTLDDDVGFVELVIKLYPNGKMSQYLDKLEVGAMLPFKGPKGRFTYKPGMVRRFGMIAGGSGITPMFQVVKSILKDPKDRTQLRLIYANVTHGDILLKDELDAMAVNDSRFKVYYVLNEPPAEWDGGVGFVTADMIKAHLPAPADDIKIVRCGPPPMMKAMAAHLETLGYSKDMTFQF